MMAYSDFTTLAKVYTDLSIEVDEANVQLFADVLPSLPSQQLTKTLAETLPLALAINTEKARSELVITPILLEVRRQASSPVALFYGTEFNVDPGLKLTGVCDFLLTHSSSQLEIKAPVVTIVEARKENINAGLGQCIAEMYAARIFNTKRDRALTIYGAVTTGDRWRFLRMKQEATTVEIDFSEYFISEIDQIIGILLHAVSDEAPKSS